MNMTSPTPSDNPRLPEPPMIDGAASQGHRDGLDRIHHLFRVLTRFGLVHPLQHLILRYRAGERA